MLEVFVISTTAVFVFSASIFYFEKRIKDVQTIIDRDIGSIKDRIHTDDRTYYEHRKSINSRIGVAEEKLGFLSDIIDNKKLEIEIAELEAELALKSPKKKAPVKKGRSK